MLAAVILIIGLGSCTALIIFTLFALFMCRCARSH